MCLMFDFFELVLSILNLFLSIWRPEVFIFEISTFFYAFWYRRYRSSLICSTKCGMDFWPIPVELHLMTPVDTEAHAGGARQELWGSVWGKASGRGTEQLQTTSTTYNSFQRRAVILIFSKICFIFDLLALVLSISNLLCRLEGLRCSFSKSARFLMHFGIGDIDPPWFFNKMWNGFLTYTRWITPDDARRHGSSRRWRTSRIVGEVFWGEVSGRGTEQLQTTSTTYNSFQWRAMILFFYQWSVLFSICWHLFWECCFFSVWRPEVFIFEFSVFFIRFPHTLLGQTVPRARKFNNALVCEDFGAMFDFQGFLETALGPTTFGHKASKSRVGRTGVGVIRPTWARPSVERPHHSFLRPSGMRACVFRRPFRRKGAACQILIPIPTLPISQIAKNRRGFNWTMPSGSHRRPRVFSAVWVLKGRWLMWEEFDARISFLAFLADSLKMICNSFEFFFALWVGLWGRESRWLSRDLESSVQESMLK